jgi:hypothetical protein
MSEIQLGAKELFEKARTARKDVLDVAALRLIDVPRPGESFFVKDALFIWAPDDRTPDDGLVSVKPKALGDSSPGRYLRATAALGRRSS